MARPVRLKIHGVADKRETDVPHYRPACIA